MYEVYSVESRKGGVGKTTIALNLAKALIRKGYDVLLVDCDITGTPITDAALHSPFWKGNVKAVSHNEKPCNLIKFFKDVYLPGGGLDKAIIDKFEYEEGIIHLLGSELYDDKGQVIIDPRYLMDDLHSFWFVELIKNLAEVFVEKSGKNNMKAIILDNSPGYVGVGKSVRDWLSSIGPDHAHYVLVSSLDEQDVESTISAALDIQRQTNDKWVVASEYEKVRNGKASFDTIKKIITRNQAAANFYYSLVDGDGYPSSYEKEPELKDYVSMVVNKVPQSYQDVGIHYQFDDKNSEERRLVINELFPQKENGLVDNMIEYDASISGQFIESNVVMATDGKDQAAALDKLFSSFMSRLTDYSKSQDKVKDALSVMKSYKEFRVKLKDRGYKQLSTSIGTGLVSENYITDMTTIVSSLGNVAIPQVDHFQFSKEELQETDRQLLGKLIAEKGNVDNSVALYSLFSHIYKTAGFANKSYNKYLIVNLSLLFKLLIHTQRDIYQQQIPYRNILVEGYLEKNVAKGMLEKLQNSDIALTGNIRIKVDISVMNLFRRYFVKFYQQMCYTLLRLIDFQSDYLFVLDACKATIYRGGRIMDGDLRNYVKQVVTQKTTTYDKSKYDSYVERPFEMKVIQEALVKLVLS